MLALVSILRDNFSPCKMLKTLPPLQSWGVGGRAHQSTKVIMHFFVFVSWRPGFLGCSLVSHSLLKGSNLGIKTQKKKKKEQEQLVLCNFQDSAESNLLMAFPSFSLSPSFVSLSDSNLQITVQNIVQASIR